MCDAHHLWATDYRWYKAHDFAREFTGKRWTVTTAWNGEPEAHGITGLKADTAARGLSADPDVIHTGKNSGYAAINLAYHLGATRILLLGFDMQVTGKSRHWFGAHPAGMEVASDYGSFIRRFHTINPDDYGIEILNVTRSTALDCFPRHNLEDLL